MSSAESGTFIGLLQERMDTSSHDKVSDIQLCIDKCEHLSEHPRILSLGAGTGKVERQIAIDNPNAEVVAIDFNLAMIEEIQKNAVLPEQRHNLSIVRGQIDRLPFGEETFDIIIASSVIHEVISSRDHGKPGKHTEHLFQQISRRLHPKGMFMIRDFVQPDKPNDIVGLRIGAAIKPEDAEPKNFVDRFSQEFKAADFRMLRYQIELLKQRRSYGPGSVLYLPYAEAIEIGAHYSWSKRFEAEVKERYACFTMLQYQQFIQRNFRAMGIETIMRARYSYLQPGYPQHINGRLDAYSVLTGKPLHMSPFSGVMAFQRTN